MNTMPLDLGRLNVPLVERDSLTCVEDILLSPDAPPAACPELVLDQVRQCAAQVLEARKNGAGVILIYGAHLLRNGAAQNSRANDGARLDHPPGHQWRRDDS